MTWDSDSYKTYSVCISKEMHKKITELRDSMNGSGCPMCGHHQKVSNRFVAEMIMKAGLEAMEGPRKEPICATNKQTLQQCRVCGDPAVAIGDDPLCDKCRLFVSRNLVNEHTTAKDVIVNSSAPVIRSGPSMDFDLNPRCPYCYDGSCHECKRINPFDE